jgi:hypothetical protein
VVEPSVGACFSQTGADAAQVIDALAGAVVVIPMVTLFNSTAVISTLAMVATMRAVVVVLFMAGSCESGRAARGLLCQVRRKGPTQLDERRRRDRYV